jgi:hypothetical protein
MHLFNVPCLLLLLLLLLYALSRAGSATSRCTAATPHQAC